jgi:hypothetical protein
MIYDYYGFPEHTYKIEYLCAGDPLLAERVVGLLYDAGLPAASDADKATIMSCTHPWQSPTQQQTCQPYSFRFWLD